MGSGITRLPRIGGFNASAMAAIDDKYFSTASFKLKDFESLLF